MAPGGLVVGCEHNLEDVKPSCRPLSMDKRRWSRATRRKWGLALGGGGLRGAAHVGVLKVLEREGLIPDFFSGTSAGAIVASLYCSGLDAAQIERLALRIIDREPDVFKGLWDNSGLNSTAMERLSLAVGARFPKSFIRTMFGVKGLINGTYIEKTLGRILEDRALDEVEKPLAIEAVDLASAELVVFITPGSVRDDLKTPDLVYIDDTKLSEAVRASISVPVLFVPKEIKGRKLIDGGVKDNVPVGVLRQMGARIVVAVDLGKPRPGGEYDNVLSILIRSLEMTGREMTLIKLRVAADLVIAPNVSDVGHLDFSRIPELIEEGERSCIEALPRISDLVCRT
jgi:NTE family protein